MMKVARFEKYGQNIWENEGVFSGCVKVTIESFDIDTWSVNITTHMHWIKANSEKMVEKAISMVTKQLEAGNLVSYRVFSETPMYEGQEEDVNPTTNAKLGRYSQSRLGSPAKALELDRKFIKPTLTKIHTELSSSTVSTSSLKDKTSMLSEKIEVCDEVIPKNYDVDKHNQYFENEKKERQKEVEESEKGNSWVKLIFFLFGLLFVLMIFLGVLNGIGEVFSSIPWYLNIVLIIGGVFVISKLIE